MSDYIILHYCNIVKGFWKIILHYCNICIGAQNCGLILEYLHKNDGLGNRYSEWRADTHFDTHIYANNAKFSIICDGAIKDIENENSLQTAKIRGLQAVIYGAGNVT